MANDTHRKDCMKLAAAHLALALTEAAFAGATVALAHLVMGGVYLHIATRRR